MPWWYHPESTGCYLPLSCSDFGILKLPPNTSSQWPKGKMFMSISIYDNRKRHTDHWLFQIDNLTENVTVVMAGWTPEEVELYLKQSYNQIDLILPEDFVKVESVLSFKVSEDWFISLCYSVFLGCETRHFTERAMWWYWISKKQPSWICWKWDGWLPGW